MNFHRFFKSTCIVHVQVQYMPPCNPHLFTLLWLCSPSTSKSLVSISIHKLVLIFLLNLAYIRTLFIVQVAVHVQLPSQSIFNFDFKYS